MSHVIVADLGYGDSGKGTVTDWLCSPLGSGSLLGDGPVRTVVRFNGGAQAAHNVVAADGRHHTFAQFGSGSFTPGVRTHLSRFVLVDPLALAAEATHLASVGVPDALDRLTVDRDALLATPYHRAANRARELARGRDRHGSCGMGIGETVRYALDHPADAPRVADCAAPRTLARLLRRLRDRLTEELGPLEGPDVPGLCDAYRAFAERVPPVDAAYLRRPAARRARPCSRERRASCSTSGAASIPTPPGRPPPSPTRRPCWPRRIRPPSASASSART